MLPAVFLSVPSVLTPEQEAVRNRWTGWLAASGLRLRGLTSEPVAGTPWQELVRVLSDVDALIVLGFGQLHVREGVWCPGTAHERAISAGKVTSPWLHVEVGMAAVLGLPTLLVAEHGVGEGVFRAENWAGALFGISLEAGPDAPDVESWRAAVNQRRGGPLVTP
jgi:hypothetical protein